MCFGKTGIGQLAAHTHDGGDDDKRVDVDKLFSHGYDYILVLKIEKENRQIIRKIY